MYQDYVTLCLNLLHDVCVRFSLKADCRNLLCFMESILALPGICLCFQMLNGRNFTERGFCSAAITKSEYSSFAELRVFLKSCIILFRKSIVA